jgi:hypothetical protein
MPRDRDWGSMPRCWRFPGLSSLATDQGETDRPSEQDQAKKHGKGKGKGKHRGHGKGKKGSERHR